MHHLHSQTPTETPVNYAKIESRPAAQHYEVCEKTLLPRHDRGHYFASHSIRGTGIFTYNVLPYFTIKNGQM